MFPGRVKDSLILRAGFLTSVISAALTCSAAEARQVQLLTFRSVEERAETDASVAATRQVDSDGAPLSAEALRQDFASVASTPEVVSRIIEPQVERSTIAVPLWMRTGMPTGVTLSSAAPATPNFSNPLACTTSPYRLRGDLPFRVEQRRARYYPLISAVACEAGVPVGLLDALVAQESQYNPLIASPKGAVGLTQLMPGTAADLSVFDRRDPLQNLRGGARYLRAQLNEFKRVDLALAAYNAGPERVRLSGRVPPFRETIDYVSAITRGWSASAFRAASIQTASSLAKPPALRTAQLLIYTSTSVPYPR